MGIQLVIFDLDETLVHATEVPLSHARDFQLGRYFVYVRPFASELIKVSASRFDIAVWSSSSQQYVEAVSTALFGQSAPLKFLWSVSRCVQKADPKSRGYVYVKDLRRVMKHGYTVDQIIMLDDSPEKLQRQPAQHLCVPAFLGDPDDRALLDIIGRIEALE